MANPGFDWSTEHALKVGAMLAGTGLSKQQIDSLRTGLAELVDSVAPGAWAKVSVTEARKGSRAWTLVGKKMILNGK